MGGQEEGGYVEENLAEGCLDSRLKVAVAETLEGKDWRHADRV